MLMKSSINAKFFCFFTLASSFPNTSFEFVSLLGNLQTNKAISRGKIDVILKTVLESKSCIAIPPKKLPSKVPVALAIQLLLCRTPRFFSFSNLTNSTVIESAHTSEKHNSIEIRTNCITNK